NRDLRKAQLQGCHACVPRRCSTDSSLHRVDCAGPPGARGPGAAHHRALSACAADRQSPGLTTALILAAGLGERLRPLTDRVPKALVEVGGVSLLERQLARLSRAGVETVVINLGWMGNAILERIGDGNRFGLQVVYGPEYDDVLET